MARQPEKIIQERVEGFLHARGWYTEGTHGNAFQRGFPDLYAIHARHGQRWIDIKVPHKYSLTKAQKLKWPLWEANGGQIWIITAADEEEYRKLFLPPNWRQYWKDSYGVIPDVDAILAAMANTDNVEEIWRILNANTIKGTDDLGLRLDSLADAAEDGAGGTD